MHTFDLSWVEELRQQSAEDMQYCQLHEKLLAVEQEFQDLRQSLEPEQKQILDAYLLQLRKMETCLVRLSYTLGEAHERKQANKTDARG